MPVSGQPDRTVAMTSTKCAPTRESIAEAAKEQTITGCSILADGPVAFTATLEAY